MTQEVVFDTEPMSVSSSTYQVDYHVLRRNLSGKLINDTYYRALITTELMNPADDDLNINPLGIYISSFDFKTLKTNNYGE